MIRNQGAHKRKPPTQHLYLRRDKPVKKLVNRLYFQGKSGYVGGHRSFFRFLHVKQRKTGVVIRDGVIGGDKTYCSTTQRGWIVVYEGVNVKANLSDAFTAQEYWDQGARSVFAFGPILITNDELGKNMLDEDHCMPRTMNDHRYDQALSSHHLNSHRTYRYNRGSKLSWMADRMLELSVTEALNSNVGGWEYAQCQLPIGFWQSAQVVDDNR